MTAEPKRIQLRRTSGWRLSAGAVVVSRPSRYGNPWTVKQGYTPAECAARFETYIVVRRNPPAGWADLVGYPSDEEIRRDLAGRDLACWCGPDAACHVDTLLIVANSEVR
jgi:hypothetical protein